MDAVIERLLASGEPSVRLRTQTEILGEPASSSGLRRVRTEVKRSERVNRLLSERTRGVLPHHPYAKWYGAHWVLAALADLGYPEGESPSYR